MSIHKNDNPNINPPNIVFLMDAAQDDWYNWLSSIKIVNAMLKYKAVCKDFFGIRVLNKK